MANFTKQAIKASFIRLLERKPLSQITIRDIVEDCGVNRNTFYYYFRDLPNLVESIINEEADKLVHKYPKIDSLQECMESIIAFALQNRKAVLHIYHSISRDVFEQYQWRACDHAVKVYTDGILAERQISEEDRELIVEYIKWLMFGFVMHWMESGMDAQVMDKFHRLCQLKQGDLEKMIAQCET